MYEIVLRYASPVMLSGPLLNGHMDNLYIHSFSVYYLMQYIYYKKYRKMSVVPLEINIFDSLNHIHNLDGSTFY